VSFYKIAKALPACFPKNTQKHKNKIPKNALQSHISLNISLKARINPHPFFPNEVLFNGRRKFAHNEVVDGYLASTSVRCDVAQTGAANADCDVFQRLHSCSFSSAD